MLIRYRNDHILFAILGIGADEFPSVGKEGIRSLHTSATKKTAHVAIQETLTPTLLQNGCKFDL